MKPLAPRDALALVLGPAWSQNTPHTAEEASVILGATEPRHALRDRMHHRMQRTLGNVVLEPSPRVTPGEPMPEATMPRAQWRATWRDAEVPPLCELRERCEATGAVPVVVQSVASGVVDRYRAQAIVAPAGSAGPEATLDAVLRCPRRPVDWEQHVPADAEPQDYDARERVRIRRANPLPWAPRDWCEGLAGGPAFDAQRDDDPAATWQAMRVACPERVYPEPTAGESE